MTTDEIKQAIDDNSLTNPRVVFEKMNEILKFQIEERSRLLKLLLNLRDLIEDQAW